MCVSLCDSALSYAPDGTRLKQLREDAISEWINLAHSCYNNRDYVCALREYENILKHAAANLGVIKRAAECAKIQGLSDKELECLRKWVENFPRDFEAHDRFGQFYERTRNWEKAEEAYFKALEIRPSEKLTRYNLEQCRKNVSNIRTWRQQIEYSLVKNDWTHVRSYSDSILALTPGDVETKKTKEKANYHFVSEKLERAIEENDFIAADELLSELGTSSMTTPSVIDDYSVRIAKGKTFRAGYPELSFVEVPDTTRLRRIEIRLHYRLQAPLRTIIILFNDRPLSREQYRTRAPSQNRPGEIVLSLSLEAQRNQIVVHIWDQEGRDARLTRFIIYPSGGITTTDNTRPVITLLEHVNVSAQQGKIRHFKPVAGTLDEISLEEYVSDDVAVASLSINGKAIQLTGGPQRCDFKYTERVRAISDTLRLACIAKDNAGNTARQTFKIAVSVESEIRSCMGKTWAVLIANSAYTYFGDLKGEPYQDVARLRQALSFYCFDSVVVKRDISTYEFEPFFESLYHDIVKEKIQSILIYYAGHGSYHRIGDSEWSYWVPVDGAQDSRVGYLEDQKIREYLEEYNRHAKHILVIADCCFSGNLPMTRSGREAIKPTEADHINLQKDVCRKSALGITSSRKDEAAKNESFFSKKLDEILIGNRNLYLRDEDLAYEVKRLVREKLSEQQPQSRPFAWIQDEGKFVFIRK